MCVEVKYSVQEKNCEGEAYGFCWEGRTWSAFLERRCCSGVKVSSLVAFLMFEDEDY